MTGIQTLVHISCVQIIQAVTVMDIRNGLVCIFPEAIVHLVLRC